MLTSNLHRWLDIVRAVGQESGWDRSLLFTMETDDRTLVVQVRQSPLIFTIRENAIDPPAYTVSYTVYRSGASTEVTARRITAGESVPPARVDEELERWLRQSVGIYATEIKPRD